MVIRNGKLDTTTTVYYLMLYKGLLTKDAFSIHLVIIAVKYGYMDLNYSLLTTAKS